MGEAGAESRRGATRTCGVGDAAAGAVGARLAARRPLVREHVAIDRPLLRGLLRDPAVLGARGGGGACSRRGGDLRFQ